MANWLSTLGRALLVTAVVTAALVAAGWQSVWPDLDHLTRQWRDEWLGGVPTSGDVVIVAIDDEAIAALGGWPPDRTRLAAAIDAIGAAGASVIALDLLLIDERPGDRDLASALADNPTVLAYAFTVTPGDGATGSLPAPIARSAMSAVQADPDLARQTEAWGTLTPALPLAIAARGLGHVTIALDRDGRLRRDLLAIAYDGAFYPSLSLEAARTALGLHHDDVRLRLGQALTLGARTLPLSGRASLTIAPHGAGAIDTLSLARILDDPAAAAQLAGRAVVVGATAPGLGDYYAGALGPRRPGVAHIASSIETLMHGPVRYRPNWAPLAEIAAALLIGLALAAGWRANPWIGAGLAPTLGALWFAGTIYAQSAGLLLAVVPVWLVLATVFVSTAGMSVISERAAMRRAGTAQERLAQFVPAAAREKTPPDRTATLAILFVDLIGFTGQSEARAPEDTQRQLQEFHQAVEQAVEAHGGAIDKFVGDGAMAVFGMAGENAEIGIAATDAAIDLLARLEELNRRVGHDNAMLRVAIGIHVGFARIGIVGGARLRQLTVTGDAVNVASRLEQMVRDFDTELLVSQPVVESIRAFGRRDLLARLEELGPRPVRGRHQPISLWRLRATGDVSHISLQQDAAQPR